MPIALQNALVILSEAKDLSLSPMGKKVWFAESGEWEEDGASGSVCGPVDESLQGRRQAGPFKQFG